MNPVRRGTVAAVQMWREMTRERVPPRVAEAILARAQGHCEACGWPGVTLIIHHRRLRSQSGKHTTGNCIAIHPACHSWIHNNPDKAHDLGLLLWNGESELRPVVLTSTLLAK